MAVMTPMAKLAYGGVIIYRYLRAGQPSPCRFTPSCSHYALDALEFHGALRGGWLIVRRLCRCHPWGSQGFDPVPPAACCREVESDNPVRSSRGLRNTPEIFAPDIYKHDHLSLDAGRNLDA